MSLFFGFMELRNMIGACDRLGGFIMGNSPAWLILVLIGEEANSESAWFMQIKIL